MKSALFRELFRELLLGLTLAATTFNLVAAETNNTSRPTLFLIGDSTVNNPNKNLQGWGTPITALFETNKLNVINRARGGRSSRTFYTEGLWDKVAAELKPGDFVLMQFGHNDGGSLNTSRARASLKGIGEDTQEVTLTNGVKEVVHTFGWYLRKFVTDTKAKVATPIVLSLIPRNDWKGGKVLRASTGYGKYSREVAASEKVGFIDLNEIVATHYEAIGQEKVKAQFFLTEHTHTTPAGARLNAACVVEGIRSLKDCQLNRFLLPDAGATLDAPIPQANVPDPKPKP